MNNKIIITNFTDPVCTWCWGSEPIFRKLQTHFKDKIEFKFIMGGLVKDARDFMNYKSADFTKFNKQIANHWLEANARHKMPVNAQNFDLFSSEFASSYPQSIAYKAAQLIDKQKADEFLYLLRFSVAARALKISHENVLIQLANECNLDISKFLEYIDNGVAKEEFQKDLEFTKRYMVSGFPTFLISYNGEELMLKGFNRYENFKSIIENISNFKEEKPEISSQNLLNFMQNHPIMSLFEIEMSFGDTKIIDDLVNDKKLIKKKFGNGELVKLVKDSSFCGINGICW